MIPYISIEKINDFSKLLSKNIENIQIELEELEELEEELDENKENKENKYISIKKRFCKSLIKLNRLGCYTLQGQPYINDEKLYQRSYLMCLISKQDLDYVLENLENEFVYDSVYFSISSFYTENEEHTSNTYNTSNINIPRIILNQDKTTTPSPLNYIFNTPLFYDEMPENFVSFIKDVQNDHSNRCSEHFYKDLINNYLFLFITSRKDYNEEEEKEEKDEIDIEFKIEKILLYIYKNKMRNYDWLPIWLLVIFIFYLVGISLYIFSIFKMN